MGCVSEKSPNYSESKRAIVGHMWEMHGLKPVDNLLDYRHPQLTTIAVTRYVRDNVEEKNEFLRTVEGLTKT
jgi:hypothetical protein